MFGPARRLRGIASSISALSALSLLAVPFVAHADVMKVNACDNSALSQPFTPWADFASYKHAPGADFEGQLTGWSLERGAARTRGSETFAVSGTPGSSSLALRDGAAATSPATCVNAAYPTFRLFTRTGTPGSTVTVYVVYGSAKVAVGVITATRNWKLSPPMLTGSAIAGAAAGGSANVRLQFTAGGGTVQVDDVYVDPFSRCC